MNTNAKQGKKTSEVERVIAAYNRGQNIFRRPSVSPLLKYISELEARLTPRAADGAYSCACGDMFPNTPFCLVCGDRAFTPHR
jgi:hypothetical protein